LYSHVAGKALRQIGRANPSLEDVKSYRETMRRDGNSASSRFNTLTALQHWFCYNGYEVKFKKPKRQRKSPTYLTESEAHRLIEACENVKEKAVIY
jgi:integrase